MERGHGVKGIKEKEEMLVNLPETFSCYSRKTELSVSGVAP